MSKTLIAIKPSSLAEATPAAFVGEFYARLCKRVNNQSFLACPEDCILTFEAIVKRQPIPDHVGYLLELSLLRVLPEKRVKKAHAIHRAGGKLARSKALESLVWSAMKEFHLPLHRCGTIDDWRKLADTRRAYEPSTLAALFERNLEKLLTKEGLAGGAKPSTVILNQRIADAGIALHDWYRRPGSKPFQFKGLGVAILKSRLDRLVVSFDESSLCGKVGTDCFTRLGHLESFEEEDSDLFEAALRLLEIPQKVDFDDDEWVEDLEDWLDLCSGEGEDNDDQDQDDEEYDEDDQDEDDDQNDEEQNEEDGDNVGELDGIEAHAMLFLGELRKELERSGHGRIQKADLSGVLEALALFYMGKEGWKFADDTSLRISSRLSRVITDLARLNNDPPSVCAGAAKAREYFSHDLMGKALFILGVGPLTSPTKEWMRYVPGGLRKKEALFGEKASTATGSSAMATVSRSIIAGLTRNDLNILACLIRETAAAGDKRVGSRMLAVVKDIENAPDKSMMVLFAAEPDKT